MFRFDSKIKILIKKLTQQVTARYDYLRDKKLTKANEKSNKMKLDAMNSLFPNYKWGINKEKSLQFGGINKKEGVFITKHLKNDLLIETDEAFILSTKGKLYADGIASDLFRVNQLN